MPSCGHRLALCAGIISIGISGALGQGLGGTSSGPVGATGGAKATQNPGGTAAPPANPATPPGGPVTVFPGSATSSAIQPTSPNPPSGPPDATLSTRIGPNGFPCGSPATGGPSVAISPNNSGATQPPGITGANLNPAAASSGRAC